MKIIGQRVILRDPIKKDIEDRIRWETEETEWLDWDAPWELENGEPFDPEEYRNLMNKKLSKPKNPNEIRYGFQICINNRTMKHIGWVNSYFIDDNYCYTANNGKLAIGIDIPDLNARRKGYATEAWCLFIRYLLDKGFEEIYTQTWSGNTRVIGLINKVGFVECDRKKNYHMVKGKLYDALTFKLDIGKFNEFYKDYFSGNK